MSSFLRVFKILGEETLLYRLTQDFVVIPDFTAIAKDAYDLK